MGAKRVRLTQNRHKGKTFYRRSGGATAADSIPHLESPAKFEYNLTKYYKPIRRNTTVKPTP